MPFISITHPKAKLNAKDAFVDIRFVQRDLRTFTHQRLFDEMICQLPSVRKKEESATEEKLYQLTFSKVKDLMEVGGIFAVYSKENDLVNLIDGQAQMASLTNLSATSNIHSTG